jgi:putative transposase
LRKWRRLRCKAVVSSPEEAGEELFTFLQFPKLQWKALRTTNALERINEEFRRRTKDRLLCPVRMLSCYYSLASCAAARSCFVAWMAGRTYPT